MTVKVKICGLKTEAAMAAALDAGADFVGLVFFPASPRHVSFSQARMLAGMARGKAKVVALLVDPDDDLLDEIINDVDPDIVQLHGAESPERAAQIARRCERPVMKAIKVETGADASLALDYKHANSMILFDAKAPAGRASEQASEQAAGQAAGQASLLLPGGNGIAFDWRVLDKVKLELPFMLSGGLDPDNVAEAIALTGACAVDVSSGVETAPGEKNADLIARFVLAAKA